MKSALIDITGLAGVGLVGYGSWLIYQPAAFIVTGGLLLSYAVVAGKAQSSQPLPVKPQEGAQ
jgi:hypothetical protein